MTSIEGVKGTVALGHLPISLMSLTGESGRKGQERTNNQPESEIACVFLSGCWSL